jgi:SAM-dependent methyltransferase
MATDYYTITETLKRRGVGRILRKVYERRRFLLSSRLRRCLCCDRHSVIVSMDDTGEAQRCLRCGANLRYELLADFIRKSAIQLSGLDILEVDPSSPLRAMLENGRSLTRTFWSDQGELGHIRADGARCEDLTRLTFADNSFDMIVSSEVLEHVENYQTALSEIRRVLRPGGMHIFTVPVSGRDASIKRASRRPDGTIEHLVKPEYHGDPEGTGEGILAFWTFGTDAVSALSVPGLATEIASERRNRQGDLLRQVFVSQKPQFPLRNVTLA